MEVEVGPADAVEPEVTRAGAAMELEGGPVGGGWMPAVAGAACAAGAAPAFAAGAGGRGVAASTAALSLLSNPGGSGTLAPPNAPSIPATPAPSPFPVSSISFCSCCSPRSSASTSLTFQGGTWRYILLSSSAIRAPSLEPSRAVALSLAMPAWGEQWVCNASNLSKSRGSRQDKFQGCEVTREPVRAKSSSDLQACTGEEGRGPSIHSPAADLPLASF